jgi:predicted DNA-binding transcriptional regulator AlpA
MNTRSITPRVTPQLLSVRDVATRLGCGVSTVWRYAQIGLLPRPGKYGAGLSRWSVQDIEAFERGGASDAAGSSS